ncbi:MAG: reverse transcriptase, partial [Lachnospiraceae bacterium]|nr:reverse transcriptase [Lachnospiraceae bacterium]
VKYVVRYMDDVVIFHESKQYLHWLVRQMDEYLKNELDVNIKGNWQVFPTEIRGVDFVGYRFFYGYKLLRKKTCKRFKRKMLNIKKKQGKGEMINYSEWCSVNSYVGWLQWCDSWRLFEKYIEPILASVIKYYADIVVGSISSKQRAEISSKYLAKLLKKKGRLA